MHMHQKKIQRKKATAPAPLDDDVMKVYLDSVYSSAVPRPSSFVPAKISSSSTSAVESADNTSPFLSVAAAQRFRSSRVRWWGMGTVF